MIYPIEPLNRAKRFFTPFVVFILFMLVAPLATPQIAGDDHGNRPYIGMRMPTMIDPRVPIFEEEFQGLYMDGARNAYLRNTLGIKRSIEIDSTGQYINFVEKFGEYEYTPQTNMSISDYVYARRQHQLRQKFVSTMNSRLKDSARGSGGSAIRIDIPVEITNKTFQKIFGGTTVGLDVSGNINIKGGFRNEKRSEVKTAFNRGSDNHFKMEQQQQFKVGGHVGEKVKIDVDQDSERAFDFDNNIRLKYTGYEDEIIQSIEAGNISLSLPGTRFVTFGGKSSGLFGIKTEATIGALKLTAIASQEKGEKKKLSLDGGSESEAKTLQAYNYKKGVYYFVDEYYKEQYTKRDADGVFLVEKDRILRDYELYKSGPKFQQKYPEAAIQGWAWALDDEDMNTQTITERDTALGTSDDMYKGYFVRMEKTEYYLDENLGYIRLDMALTDGEVLAIAYRDTTHRVRGQIDYDPESNSPIQLRLIKPETPKSTDKTWDLAWKHVYSIGPRNMDPDGFEMKILYRSPSAGNPIEDLDVLGTQRTLLEIFGLDKVDQNGSPNPDGLVDNNVNIINFARGELFMPLLRPFDPEEGATTSDEFDIYKIFPADWRAGAIYDTTAQNVIVKENNFYFEIKSESKSSEYRLGLNVIENSEEVILNGRKLTSGIDYTINYMTGTLRLLNEEALQANAKLDVTYESNQFFQIDKKTVMGLRAEYDLWDDSYIGGTFLYLNERTLDQKVRVGKGPMRNMIWDVNTSLGFEPFFLTKMANYIPFVDTRAPSTLKFEGEIAQIIPNPNTRNNEKTGDDNGVAYIDDFEAAKRTTPITIARRGWSFSSPPEGKFSGKHNVEEYALRGKVNYYNPYSQYPIRQIWPNRDVNANVAQTANVFNMIFWPTEENVPDLTESWGGIQRALSAGYYNQSESKYLELMIKVSDPTITTANLHIDMGQISEDIIPNGKLDTEDIPRGTIYNDLLDDGEDIGLDRMADDDPRAIEAGGDYWDINGNGIKDFGEPFSDDNWSYKPSNNTANIDYSKANGTEGNENDGVRKPDTEDMNGNGDVDLTNNYFSYKINLNWHHPDSVFITGKSIDKDKSSENYGTDFGWRKYTIPLHGLSPENFERIGNPDFQQIEYIRLWVDGISSSAENLAQVVQIAEINIVGSEWKEAGIAGLADEEEYDDKNDSTVVVTTLNTHDNDEYIPPPGVEGETDRITRVVAKEQALVLDVHDLLPGENGIIQKTFYEAQDYINYETMKMFLYGYDEWGTHITADSTNIEFFLRFGSNENNYYEIRQPIYEGWSKNHMEVDLVELSQLKFTAQVDTADGDAFFRKIFDNGTVWTIKNEPALRNIKLLTAGVKNLGPEDPNHTSACMTPFNGKIYMNELRLSNVKKDKGIAMRARVDFALADIFRVNGELNKKDADFHNVATRFGTGDNEISGNINTSFSVDKFLPRRLGLTIPVSLTYSRSESTPKYKPGTDVEVTDALPDSVIESIQTLNENRGMNVSFGINSRSQNFVMKHLLSKLKASYSLNEGKSSNSRVKKATTKKESGKLSWGINFGRDTFIRPMGFLEESRFLAKLSDIKLYYTPQSITTSINGSRSNNLSISRTGVESPTNSFTVNRSLAGKYKVIESLSVDLSRSYVNDLRDVSNDTIIDFLKQGKIAGLLTGMDQNFGIKYNPKIFSWLTNNFSYTVGFKYGFNRQQKLAARTASQNKSASISGNLNLATLMKTVYKPTSSGRGRNTSRAANTPRRAAPRANANANADDEKKEEKKKSGRSFSILGMTATALNVVDPISINFSNRANISAVGMQDIPTSAFMFGLSDSTGVPLEFSGTEEGSSATLNRGSSSDNTTMSLNSGIKIGRNVKLTLKYDQSSSINRRTTTTGQRQQSWLLYGDGISLPFPDWTLRISGLEKIKLFKGTIQQLQLEHGFSGQSSETFDYKNNRENVTKEDKGSSFRPLLGMNMKMKNGISFNARYNTSEKLSYNKTVDEGGTRTSNQEVSVTAKYSKRSDFSFAIPMLKRFRLKNSVDIAMTFSMSSNKTEKSRGGGDFQVTTETSKWLLKPTIDYSFSDRVRGGTYFEIGKTHNKQIGDTTYKEFGINVNIAIRGS